MFFVISFFYKEPENTNVPQSRFMYRMETYKQEFEYLLFNKTPALTSYSPLEI